MRKKLAPVHPGEVLLEDWMQPIGLSANHLATELRVPATRIGDIIRGRRGISADSALRLARYFGTSAAFWIGMQAQYDLETAEDAFGKTVERDVRPLKRSA